MKYVNKIKAFTLSEMIVVLILTSVVVGLAFSVLTLVQKQMLGIQHNFNNNTRTNLFEKALWLDFNRYTYVHYDDLNDVLIFKTEIDSVTYNFYENKIIKDTDTFNLQIPEKAFYFKGKDVEFGQIDAVKLKISKDSHIQELFVFKQNDATSFMK